MKRGKGRHCRRGEGVEGRRTMRGEGCEGIEVNWRYCK